MVLIVHLTVGHDRSSVIVGVGAVDVRIPSVTSICDRLDGRALAFPRLVAEPPDPQAVELHCCHLGDHSYEPLLDDLETDQWLAELLSGSAVAERRVIRADRVPESGKCGCQPSRGKDSAGVLEAVRAGKTRIGGDAHAGQLDLGLPDRAYAALALDHARVVSRGARLDEKGLDLAVPRVAGPHDDHVGDRAIPDPPLGAVDHIVPTVAAGGRLE
jgi:hypothetical protein